MSACAVVQIILEHSSERDEGEQRTHDGLQSGFEHSLVGSLPYIVMKFSVRIRVVRHAPRDILKGVVFRVGDLIRRSLASHDFKGNAHVIALLDFVPCEIGDPRSLSRRPHK